MIYARCKKHLCSLQICFFEVREKRFVRKILRHASFPVAYNFDCGQIGANQEHLDGL